MAKDEKGKGKRKGLSDVLKSMPFVNTSKDSPRYGERFTVVHRDGVRYNKYAGGQLVADKGRGSATTRHQPGVKTSAAQVTASARPAAPINPAQQATLDQITQAAASAPSPGLSVKSPQAATAAEREAQRQAAQTALKAARKRRRASA